MTNAEKFAEVFGADIYREYFSESCWEEEYKPLLPVNSEQKIIENIKAEIQEMLKEPAIYIPNYEAYKNVLEIIERHTRGAKMEGDKENGIN